MALLTCLNPVQQIFDPDLLFEITSKLGTVAHYFLKVNNLFFSLFHCSVSECFDNEYVFGMIFKQFL